MSAFCPVKAVAKREWNSYFNSPIAYVFLMIFLALASFFTFAVARFYESGQADLSGFFYWHPWLFLVLVPAVAMRLWAEERRSGTVELLLTQPITPMQATLGKFTAAWVFLALALALTFPVVVTAYYLGQPDGGSIACSYLGSFLLAGAYLSVGLFTSALTRNQVISFVLAVVFGLFLMLAGFAPVTDLLARFAPSWLVDTVAAFGFIQHYENLRRGVIDLRDLVYFGSVIVFMLAATQVVLANRTSR